MNKKISTKNIIVRENSKKQKSCDLYIDSEFINIDYGKFLFEKKINILSSEYININIKFINKQLKFLFNEGSDRISIEFKNKKEYLTAKDLIENEL